MYLAHDTNQAVDMEFEMLDYSYAENPASQHGSSLGERKLWCAVIEQAFVDIGAIAPQRYVSAKDDKAPGIRECPAHRGKEHDEAARWLLRDNADFNRACMLAGVSPGVIRHAAHAFYRMHFFEKGMVP